MRTLLKIVLALGLALSVAGCSANEAADSGQGEVTVVKVGVVGAYNDQWDTVNELLKDDNIQVELVYFSDYALPNKALDSGDIDLNAFQHHAYLENEVAEYGYDIVAIGDTIIAPLGLFNNKDKITSVDQIQDGNQIGIPSDATNGGRALKILEELGLIVCDPQAGEMPTVGDITEKIVDIDIVELESGMLASALPDLTAALINGGNAITAGLNPTTDAIYVETIGENVDRLKNVIAARTEDQDNEIYRKVVEAYQTDEVAQTLQDSYQGAFLPAWQ